MKNNSAIMVNWPPWKIDLTRFYLGLPPQKKNSKSVTLPFMSNSPQNFGELNSAFEMYPRPKKEKLIF